MRMITTHPAVAGVQAYTIGTLMTLGLLRDRRQNREDGWTVFEYLVGAAAIIVGVTGVVAVVVAAWNARGASLGGGGVAG